MKTNKRLRNCSRLNGTNEKQQVNTLRDFELQSFALKALLGELVKLEWCVRLRWKKSFEY